MELVNPRITVRENSIKNEGISIKAFVFAMEIGELTIINTKPFVYRIDTFRVKEDFRQHDVGKKMLKKAIKTVKKHNGSKIIINPASMPYKNEKNIENKTLYEISEHLGFKFYNDDIDESKPNAIMYMII